MAGMEQMEWDQTPGNHGNHVFDTIPLIPLQSFPRARAPQLRFHQTPVLEQEISVFLMSEEMRNLLYIKKTIYQDTLTQLLASMLHKSEIEKVAGRLTRQCFHQCQVYSNERTPSGLIWGEPNAI